MWRSSGSISEKSDFFWQYVWTRTNWISGRSHFSDSKCKGSKTELSPRFWTKYERFFCFARFVRYKNISLNKANRVFEYCSCCGMPSVKKNALLQSKYTACIFIYWLCYIVLDFMSLINESCAKTSVLLCEVNRRDCSEIRKKISLVEAWWKIVRLCKRHAKPLLLSSFRKKLFRPSSKFLWFLWNEKVEKQ